MMTIGLIGAGRIGSQIARLAIAHGHHVVISNSRGPETLATLVSELGPNARAATAVDAAKAGDIVVVTLPLKNYRSVPVEPLAGKIVIDTNNYYPQRDGQIPELDNESTTVSELLQAHLPTSKVVKAFNHIYAAQHDRRPAGGRRAAARWSSPATTLTPKRGEGAADQFGFDTVDAGALKEGGGARYAGLRTAARRRNYEETSLRGARRPVGAAESQPGRPPAAGLARRKPRFLACPSQPRRPAAGFSDGRSRHRQG